MTSRINRKTRRKKGGDGSIKSRGRFTFNPVQPVQRKSRIIEARNRVSSGLGQARNRVSSGLGQARNRVSSVYKKLKYGLGLAHKHPREVSLNEPNGVASVEKGVSLNEPNDVASVEKGLRFSKNNTKLTPFKSKKTKGTSLNNPLVTNNLTSNQKVIAKKYEKLNLTLCDQVVYYMSKEMSEQQLYGNDIKALLRNIYIDFHDKYYENTQRVYESISGLFRPDEDDKSLKTKWKHLKSLIHDTNPYVSLVKDFVKVQVETLDTGLNKKLCIHLLDRARFIVQAQAGNFFQTPDLLLFKKEDIIRLLDTLKKDFLLLNNHPLQEYFETELLKNVPLACFHLTEEGRNNLDEISKHIQQALAANLQQNEALAERLQQNEALAKRLQQNEALAERLQQNAIPNYSDAYKLFNSYTTLLEGSDDKKKLLILQFNVVVNQIPPDEQLTFYFLFMENLDKYPNLKTDILTQIRVNNIDFFRKYPKLMESSNKYLEYENF